MERFIDTRTLARVKDMPLIARTVADGFLHGLQQSHQRGVGIEFSQYRSYEPGDPLSRIDWKLFARSDRYFVREAERESEISIWFVLDASASMSQRSIRTQTGKWHRKQQQSHPSWSKFDYARHLLATLSYIAQKQGDHVGMLALTSQRQQLVPTGSGERHWHRMLKHLAQVRTGAMFPKPELVRTTISRLQKKCLIFIISDFYEHSDELLQFVKQVSAGDTEVVAMQLQCEDEVNFPYKGAIRFEDLETGEQLLVSAASARSRWFDALAGHQQALEQSLRKLQVGLCRVNIDQPMDKALFSFLKNRQKLQP